MKSQPTPACQVGTSMLRIIPMILISFVLISNVRFMGRFENDEANNASIIDESFQISPSNHDTSVAKEIHRISSILLKSFSAKDRVSSEDRLGFDLTIPSFNTTNDSNCICDLVSLDCLDSIACIPHIQHPRNRHILAMLGLEIRRTIKASSIFRGYDLSGEWRPLGKSLQYSTMTAWRVWRSRNILPTGYDPAQKTIFVNETWYPECMTSESSDSVIETRLHGFSCLYRGPGESEDFEGARIENDALAWFHEMTKDSERKNIRKALRISLGEFFRDHQPRVEKGQIGEIVEEVDTFTETFLYQGTKSEYKKMLSPYGNLILFAQIARMMFNRRSFLANIYQDRVKSVGLDVNVSKAYDEERAKDGNNEPFNLALHMRRGDSCPIEGPIAYKKEATPIDSPAQTGGGLRHCYTTAVYMDAVRRVRELVPKSRPLHVYLSTDDAGDVLDEILNKRYKSISNDTNTDEDIQVERWHFLNYSRSHFNYSADYIEADEKKDNQPILGETAIADLWHLSHGHAFVGHLGSRFGKVSWLLATARQNSFVPFFSVDGHSFCCEIDEPCGAMRPYITVENCLTYGHEYSDYDHNETYWKYGSLARKKLFLDKKARGNYSLEENVPLILSE